MLLLLLQLLLLLLLLLLVVVVVPILCRGAGVLKGKVRDPLLLRAAFLPRAAGLLCAISTTAATAAPLHKERQGRC